MKQIIQQQRQQIARDMQKGYMQLLTQQVKKTAHSIDTFFFAEGDSESEEVRPYFYVAVSFGFAVVLYVLVAI